MNYDRAHEVNPDEYVVLRVDSSRLLSESPQRVGLYPQGAPAHAGLAVGEGGVLWE